MPRLSLPGFQRDPPLLTAREMGLAQDHFSAVQLVEV